jgi:Legionella pneumophila major outer membrane protein precursor
MNIGTGAGVVLLAAFGGSVRAEDGASGFALTLDGGWSQSTFTRAYAVQLGSAQYYGEYFTPDDGHFGKAALSYGFATNWDVGLSFSGQRFPTSLNGAHLGCCTLSTWTSLEMKDVSLDIGLHRQFGSADFRFGAGVMATDIQTDMRINVLGFGPGLTNGNTFDTQRFRGIGPKLSLDVALRLPGTETERLIAGIDVATLSGDLTQDRSTPDLGGGQVIESATANQRLVSAGVYLGLSVPTSKGTIRGGLRHDFVEVSGEQPLSSDDDSILQQGVGATTLFLGYSLTF